ncbi:MAG TPA: MBL fold metallo-hydrolase, partial [Rhizomicrobium sp.]|nr:MBL fold metallo-hydrolase [Rhizomicrobium sp.]
MRKSILVLLAGAAALAIPAAMAQNRDDALQMISVDVEGGGGTVFVTPNKHVVVIDTGNPDTSGATGNYPSSQRIVDAIKAAGGTKVDYLITTHYHGDHIGGLEGFLKRIKVDTFIDHGENREIRGTQGVAGMIGPDWRFVGPNGQPLAGRGGRGGPAAAPPPPPADPNVPPPNSTEGQYRNTYLRLIGNSKHRVVKVGDHIRLDGMDIHVVSADAKMPAKPLPGGGQTIAACNGMPSMASNGGEENARSTSVIITYGKTRIAAFGDLTWDREKDMVCPVNLVGRADVYLSSHHGTQWSGSPALIEALQPIVTIMGNSATKGGHPERVQTIKSNPRFQGLWLLHAARNAPQVNENFDMIANPDPAQGAVDKAHNLRLRIRPNGEI